MDFETLKIHHDVKNVKNVKFFQRAGTNHMYGHVDEYYKDYKEMNLLDKLLFKLTYKSWESEDQSGHSSVRFMVVIEKNFSIRSQALLKDVTNFTKNGKTLTVNYTNGKRMVYCNCDSVRVGKLENRDEVY